MLAFYQPFDVWKRSQRRVLCGIAVFKNLSSGRFSVQSADFYAVPLDSKQAFDLEKQYVELFAEQGPDERAGSFDSL